MEITIIYHLLEMSLIGAVTACLIMGVRLIIKNRLPKLLSYSLWGILLLRLLVPFSFPSDMSLFNLYSIGQMEHQLEVERNEMEQMVIDHEPLETTKKQQILDFNLSKWHWEWTVLGISCILILWVVGMYLRTCSKLKDARIVRRDLGTGKVKVYHTTKLITPVVCGLVRPRIILPSRLLEGPDEDVLKSVMVHEMVHIKRRDNWFKFLALITLCIHWFNPFVWMAFYLAHKDMEAACDEKAIQILGSHKKKVYASSLLSFCTLKNSCSNLAVVAFGESHIKSRVKGILDYKKPRFWIVLVSLVIFIIVALLVSDGKVKTVYVDFNEIKKSYEGQWTKLEEVPQTFLEALIVTEDPNFYAHKGADLELIVEEFFKNIQAGSIRYGGTTITQSIVKQYGYLGANSLERKKIEIYSAIELEKNYSKDEILETYINTLSFGHGTQGIDAAARYFFDKVPSQLTQEECLTLIPTIQGHTKYSPIMHPENNQEKVEEIKQILEEYNKP